MQSVHLIDRGAEHASIKAAFLHHAVGAVAAFFGGLEQQRDGIGKGVFLRERLQHARRAEHDGGVPVMAARMSAALNAALPCAFAMLVHGQRVDVGAKADRLGTGLAAWDVRDGAGATRQTADMLHADGGQFALDALRRLVFLVADLRMLMQFASEGDE